MSQKRDMGHPFGGGVSEERGLLEDPAASSYFVALVEDGGLAGGDGALGVVEDGFDVVGCEDSERGGGGLVAVADLDGHADGLGGLGDGDPVEAVGG